MMKCCLDEVEGERKGRGMRLVERSVVPTLGTQCQVLDVTEGSSSWPDCGQGGEGGRRQKLWLEGQVRTRSHRPCVPSLVPWILP